MKPTSSTLKNHVNTTGIFCRSVSPSLHLVSHIFINENAPLSLSALLSLSAVVSSSPSAPSSPSSSLCCRSSLSLCKRPSSPSCLISANLSYQVFCFNFERKEGFCQELWEEMILLSR